MCTMWQQMILYADNSQQSSIRWSNDFSHCNNSSDGSDGTDQP